MIDNGNGTWKQQTHLVPTGRYGLYVILLTSVYSMAIANSAFTMELEGSQWETCLSAFMSA